MGSTQPAEAVPAGRKTGGFVRWVPLLLGLLLAVAWGVAWASTRAVESDRTTLPGLTLAGTAIGGVPFADLDARVDAAVDAYLAGPVTLVFAGSELHRTRADVGYVVDRDEVRAEIERLGHSGDALADLHARRAGGGALTLPVSLDRAKTLELLADVKGALDRLPIEAHLDLDHHTITDSQDGHLLDVYGSLEAIEAGARAGAGRIELVGEVTPPRVSRSDLANIDISHVVGTWETDYSLAEVDRDYNLKIAADKLNGHVLMPGAVFSFNDVVGPRTQRQGYHVAPVIDKGELVDGLAGGACQISTTLHAAAFFAGLDILSTTPHSRPSHYITMGLDSTVVYPTTDLKLRNNLPFPVVIHYQVNQGHVRVELLGKARPYKVVFKRTILEETPFDVEQREDPNVPAGITIVDQPGMLGYHIKKERFVYDHKGDEVAHNTWDVKYPPTTEYDRVGTGDPDLPMPVVPAQLQKPPPPVGDELKIIRPLPGEP